MGLAPCALAYLCGEFPVNRSNTLSNSSVCQVVTLTSLRPWSVPVFGPYPSPSDLCLKDVSPISAGRERLEQSVHQLDRDEFFDRFDIAARFDIDPDAPPLSIFFRVREFLDHGLRQVACYDFGDGPVPEDKSDPKIGRAHV